MPTPSERTSEELIKRARYGGRNLAILAILATLIAGVAIAAAAKGSFEEFKWFAFGAPLVAAAYWALTVAARHGDPRSVSIVMGFLAAQFLIALAGTVLAVVRSNGAEPLNLIVIVVPLLIIAGLARNRADLVELKRRGLWEMVFGPFQAKDRLCIGGGVLMLVGLGCVYAAIFVPVFQAVGSAKLRQEFVNLVNADEKGLMDDLAAAAPLRSSRDAEILLEKANKLNRQARAMAERAPADSALQSILQRYAQATEKWCSGLAMLRDEQSPQAAQEKFAEGDALRREAFTEFEKQFPPSRKR